MIEVADGYPSKMRLQFPTFDVDSLAELLGWLPDSEEDSHAKNSWASKVWERVKKAVAKTRSTKKACAHFDLEYDFNLSVAQRNPLQVFTSLIVLFAP